MTNEELEKTTAEIWAVLRENSRQLVALQEAAQETDRMFQETREAIRLSSLETDQRIDKLAGLFTNQWGRLMEALMTADLVGLSSGAVCLGVER